MIFCANPAAQFQSYQSEIEAAVLKVLRGNRYILGAEVEALESEFANYIGVSSAIGVANGTDALELAIRALDIGPGDEVITTAFSFFATVEVIMLQGATPVLVDIDPRTYNLDVSKLEQAITSKTKAIMPVSLYGQCADMDAINEIAKRHGLAVIEDAAQSFGATYKGIKSCNLSTIACTSFFPSKPLGCYGDGGACFTNDDTLATAMRQIRVHGQEKRYRHHILGVNSRLDTLQAAILLAKLSIFDQEVKNRILIGRRYNELLHQHTKTMYIPAVNTCVYAQYTIEVPEREKMAAHLKNLGIPTAVHYPFPLHMQPVFADDVTPNKHFPVAEKAAQSVLSLPMHPYLETEAQDHIIKQFWSITQAKLES